MVLIQGLLALITRQASKLFNVVFGWATMLLFGKVPQDRQLALSAITFGSVIWLVVLLGIAFPAFGVFLLSFVPIPRWVDRGWIRIGMLVAAVVIPLVVGVLSKRIASRTQPDQAVTLSIFRGYPVTLGLALTLIMLIVLAPVMQLGHIARRWSTTHVPVIIKAESYTMVVGRIQRALDGEGMRPQRHQASWMLRGPTKLLTLLAGRTFASFVADQLAILTAPDLEVMVHPADLVISGKEATVIRARIAIAQRLLFSEANQTWTKEATDLEDQLTALWKAMAAGGVAYSTTIAPVRLMELQEQIHRTSLPFEEWEVLARATARIDETILAMKAGIVQEPKEVEELNGEAIAARIRPEETLARERAVVTAVAVSGFGLLAWLSRKMPEAREALSPGNLLAVGRIFMRRETA